MVESALSADRLIRFQAYKSLGEHEGIRAGLTWFRQNPEEFTARTVEFDEVLNSMVKRIRFVGTDWRKYKHLDGLTDALLDRDLPPSLERITWLSTQRMGQGVVRESINTFAEVNSLLDGDWAWAANLSPEKTASGLLIEGYGLMAERYLAIPGLRRKFVQAFEEELIFNHKKSKLLADVAGWMKEEQDSFSPRVQRRLKKY